MVAAGEIPTIRAGTARLVARSAGDDRAIATVVPRGPDGVGFRDRARSST
jgi:hypothetical protein